ncbi:MAG TPA: hypothetical protein VGU20_01510 [Stellaceae bacterium]|nr:hypothetical protein [Stellaceae bacterium]
MRLGVVATAVLGAGVTLALILYFGFAAIAAALAVAGWSGVAAITLYHLVPLALCGLAWRAQLRRPPASMLRYVLCRWTRDAGGDGALRRPLAAAPARVLMARDRRQHVGQGAVDRRPPISSTPAVQKVGERVADGSGDEEGRQRPFFDTAGDFLCLAFAAPIDVVRHVSRLLAGAASRAPCLLACLPRGFPGGVPRPGDRARGVLRHGGRRLRRFLRPLGDLVGARPGTLAEFARLLREICRHLRLSRDSRGHP